MVSTLWPAFWLITGATSMFVSRPSSSSVGPRMKAYFVNMDDSLMRRGCMMSQLTSLAKEAEAAGATLEFDRFPAVDFKSCDSPATCMLERPECFPSGKSAFIDHGTIGEQDSAGRARMTRGVLGNYCAHLLVLKDLLEENNEGYDFFLILEDDTIFKSGFMDDLLSFYRNHPDHWSLVAIDTFPEGLKTQLPEEDMFESTKDGGQLYSVSVTRNQYWGAHAWLINDFHKERFIKLFSGSPALPVDEFTKVNHPLHMGMWSYQIGKARQHDNFTKQELLSVAKECYEVGGSDIDGMGQSDQVVEPTDLLESVVIHRLSPSEVHSPHSSKATSEVVLLGMPGSGDDALPALMKEALPTVKVCSSCKVWSGTHPNRLVEISSRLKDAVAIVLVRHPFDVVKTLEKDPREMKCGAEPGLPAMARPCDFVGKVASDRLPSPTCDVDPYSVSCWNSTTAGWNGFAGGYKKLTSVFKKVQVVRYEDMIEQPLKVVNRIARAVGAPLQTTLPSSLDSFGSKLEAPPAPNCAEMYTICARLDTQLLFDLGYHGCQKTWLAYSELIYNGNLYQQMEDSDKARLALADWPEQMVCTN